AVMIGVVFLRTRSNNQPPKQIEVAKNVTPITPVGVRGIESVKQPDKVSVPLINATYKEPSRSSNVAALNRVSHPDQSDVIPAALDDIDNKDTTSHLEQAQNLLVSFRSIKYSDDDPEVDVSYEKAESRRLLNENIVLRRDAEMTGKFPVKSV